MARTTRKRSVALTPGRGRKLTVGFGLVSIPLEVKPLASTARPVPGKMMCPEHGPDLSSRMICGLGTDYEHMLERGETVKGFEHPDEPGTLVQLDDAVLDELVEERTGAAQITKTVDVAKIDPAYFDKPYLCWPQGGSEERYDLFAAVLRKGKAAVVTTVMTKQTRMLVLRWSDAFGAVLAHVVHFDSSLRWQDVELVQHVARTRSEPAAEAVAMAETLFASLEGEFDSSDVEDVRTQAMEDAIRQAAEGATEITVQTRPVAAMPEPDLLATLRASIEAAKQEAPEEVVAKPRRKRSKAA